MPDFDTSELDALARELAAAPAKVIPAIVPVAHRAGGNIKRRMRKDATGHRRLGALPKYVEYDVDVMHTSPAPSQSNATTGFPAAMAWGSARGKPSR